MFKIVGHLCVAYSLGYDWQAEDECQETGCALSALQLHALKKGIPRSDMPKGLKTSPYARPQNHLDIHPSKFPIHDQCKEPPCSGQIHLQLGGPGEMVVSFVSQPGHPTKSRVRYGQGTLDSEATGKVETYSQLMFWREMLWKPRIEGGYGLDQEEIAKDKSHAIMKVFFKVLCVQSAGRLWISMHKPKLVKSCQINLWNKVRYFFQKMTDD